MNKLLVTGVFAFCFTSSGLANIKTTINGSIDSQIVNVKEKGAFKKLNDYRKVSDNDIITDAYLKFGMNGTVDSGLRYGAMVKLNANTLKSKKEIFTNTKNSITEQAMIYLENEFGHVEVGSYTGISNAMKVNAATFASATGGINGDPQYYWNKAISLTTSTGNPIETIFLQTPNLPTNELGAVGIKGMNATKINYYTPEFSGFRFGISYIPDSKVHGTIASANSVFRDEDGFKNVFETGLSCIGEVKNIGIKFAMVSEFGRNKVSTKKDLKTWEVGTNLTYQGFTVRGSYGSWGKYKALKTDVNEYAGTSYWTTGIGYAYGPLSASITHLKSKKGIEANQKANTLRNTVLGVDYKIVAGLLSYLEFSSFKMNDKSSTKPQDNKSNKGHIFMFGMKLKF